MASTIRVVIADDHPLILFGATQSLAAYDNIQIVGQARHSTELIPLLSSTRCDVLVTDLAMPGGDLGDGLPLLSYIRRHYPALRIVVLTMLDNPGLLKRVKEMGVTSMINKADDLAHIGRAVISIMSGAAYVGPSIQQAFDAMRMTSTQTAIEASLSKREFEVVRLFVSGRTIKEIGAILRRSVKTVSTQKTSAMRKLGIERDSELHHYALSNGLANLSSQADSEAKLDGEPEAAPDSDAGVAAPK